MKIDIIKKNVLNNIGVNVIDKRLRKVKLTDFIKIKFNKLNDIKNSPAMFNNSINLSIELQGIIGEGIAGLNQDIKIILFTKQNKNDDSFITYDGIQGNKIIDIKTIYPNGGPVKFNSSWIYIMNYPGILKHLINYNKIANVYKKELAKNSFKINELFNIKDNIITLNENNINNAYKLLENNINYLTKIIKFKNELNFEYYLKENEKNLFIKPLFIGGGDYKVNFICKKNKNKSFELVYKSGELANGMFEMKTVAGKIRYENIKDDELLKKIKNVFFKSIKLNKKKILFKELNEELQNLLNYIISEYNIEKFEFTSDLSYMFFKEKNINLILQSLFNTILNIKKLIEIIKPKTKKEKIIILYLFYVLNLNNTLYDKLFYKDIKKIHNIYNTLGNKSDEYIYNLFKTNKLLSYPGLFLTARY